MCAQHQHIDFALSRHTQMLANLSKDDFSRPAQYVLRLQLIAGRQKDVNSCANHHEYTSFKRWLNPSNEKDNLVNRHKKALTRVTEIEQRTLRAIFRWQLSSVFFQDRKQINFIKCMRDKHDAMIKNLRNQTKMTKMTCDRHVFLDLLPRPRDDMTGLISVCWNLNKTTIFGLILAWYCWTYYCLTLYIYINIYIAYLDFSLLNMDFIILLTRW